MAREVKALIKLQCPGGMATPAPPVGPALGQHGVNIAQFVTKFNDQTKETRGLMLPVVITVYTDRTFEFIIKSPPAAILIKAAAKIPVEKKKGGEVIPGEEKTKKSGKYKRFHLTCHCSVLIKSARPGSIRNRRSRGGRRSPARPGPC